jgi:hypothetical protein
VLEPSGEHEGEDRLGAQSHRATDELWMKMTKDILRDESKLDCDHYWCRACRFNREFSARMRDAI